MTVKIGDPVVAVLSADAAEVREIGRGVYQGKHLPTPRNWLTSALAVAGFSNHRIALDAGGYVYGCECHWMPAHKYNDFVSGRRVVVVGVESVIEYEQ